MAKSALWITAAFLAFTSSVLAAPPTAVPTGTATITPTPKQQRCCFCVYPNKWEEDSDNFAAQCDKCKDTAFRGNCDVYQSWSNKEFTDEAIKKFNCSSVNLVNLQHGPNSSLAANQIKVCLSAFPGCPLSVNDLSCSTYKDEQEAQAAIEEIQKALFGGAKVNICGSGSVNVYGECSFSRISKHYVIAPTTVREELGLCPEFGEPCNFSRDGQSHHTQLYSCVDTLSRQHSIQCCSGGGPFTWGYWGDSNGCKGRGCDPKRCPYVQSCTNEEGYFTQNCVGDQHTGFCRKTKTACPPKTRCKQLEGNVALCVQRATPTAKPTTTAATR